jgi:hypothetical protein
MLAVCPLSLPLLNKKISAAMITNTPATNPTFTSVRIRLSL